MPGAATDRLTGADRLTEARAALRALSARTAALLDGIAEPRRRLRNSEWTVGEAAAHMVIALLGFTDSVRGELDDLARLVPPARPDHRFDQRLAAFNTRTRRSSASATSAC